MQVKTGKQDERETDQAQVLALVDQVLALQADIIVAAIGKKNFVTADMVKPGAIIIDVGINRETSDQTKSGYKLYGDVDFENVAPKSSWITPVPGGVGLMTIVGLLKNTLASAKGEIYS